MPRYGYGAVPLGLVLAQSALETGYWSSPVFLTGRNAFGLRLARVRPTPAVGIFEGHAAYNSLRDSVADYLDRQRVFGIPATDDPALYVSETVASGYPTALNYGATWLNVYRDGFVDYVAPAGAGGLLAVALALLVLSAAQ